MELEGKLDDDNEPPSEIDQGLAFAYGGDQSPEHDSPGAGEADPAPSVLDRIGEITGEKPCSVGRKTPV